MAGANKPSVLCCTSLLKKIVVRKELDLGLFSRVLRIFIGIEITLADSMLDAVLKSFSSIGIFGECNKVLKEIKQDGLVVSSDMQTKITFRLSSACQKDEADEFVEHMEASGNNLDYKAWASLIQGHCVSRNVEEALDCIQKNGSKRRRF
uniref:Pentatricopeptide repeat-containing protein n=1 Tax=Rhizophora mucronata TaxID=61149 RepID=A0A2P2J952_RHIMU